MAGDWLKFDKSTPDKPEVFEIASQLQIDPDSVVGKLMRVWSWFDSHTEDGNALRVTPALLDRCAGHAGFVAAMQLVGWMVIENGGCRLPKFDRHCGATAKKRALGKNRTEKSRSSNAVSVTPSVTEALPEKRREEKKEQKTRSSDDDLDASFEEFWRVYPRKVAKQSAMKAWAKLKPDGELAAVIVADVVAQAQTPEWRKDNWRFAPHPATYLNGKRWTDEGAGAGDGAFGEASDGGADADPLGPWLEGAI